MLILQLLNEATLAPRKSHKAADTTACFHRVLPVLLAIASAPDRAVRSAALDALQALAASVKASSSHAEGTLTGAPSHCLMAPLVDMMDHASDGNWQRCFIL